MIACICARAANYRDKLHYYSLDKELCRQPNRPYVALARGELKLQQSHPIRPVASPHSILRSVRPGQNSHWRGRRRGGDGGQPGQSSVIGAGQSTARVERQEDVSRGRREVAEQRESGGRMGSGRRKEIRGNIQRK